MCGGTDHPPLGWTNPIGLSPRVRGNRARRAFIPKRHRSIPACAGEPANAGGRAADSEVYPRVCGGTGNANPLHLLR